MRTGDSSVVQFTLPFGGVQDRIWNAAKADRVVAVGKARRVMKRDDVCILVIIRALRRCELLGQARQGKGRGEWTCRVTLNAKGFRQGGSLSLKLSEGRIFVEDIHWDHQP